MRISRRFKGVGEFQEGEPEEIVRSIKPWYDGYCFAKSKIGRESVFNSDMVHYHLKALVAEGIAKLRQYASCLARATPSTVLCQ